jgi:NADH-quinone oxidoreductase subunit H
LFDSDYSVLSFLAISSTGVYGLVIAGWASYSRYALMGAIRAVAQLISYEVVLTIVLLPVIVYVGSFNFLEIVYFQSMSC